MIEFEIVPYKEFEKSAKKCGFTKEEILDAYKDIKLPKRGSSGSAGYDFYMPFNIKVDEMYMKYIPTGIRCKMDKNVVLLLVPKSGLGCKYGMGMTNTIGVIDSDYYDADNYGHIHAMIDSSIDFEIAKGQKFMQGIFVPYMTVDKDNTTTKRHGGFGSTGEF